MTEKEMKKLNTIKKILGGECTKKEAVESLGITTRQIDRLILKYKNDGETGFIHKSRGRESKKKVSENIKQEIVNLYITEYFDYNFTHFYEEIREKYKLSRKTISAILSEADIISPEAQHKTVRLYNANMKKAIRQKEATKELLENGVKDQKEYEDKMLAQLGNFVADWNATVGAMSFPDISGSGIDVGRISVSQKSSGGSSTKISAAKNSAIDFIKEFYKYSM